MAAAQQGWGRTDWWSGGWSGGGGGGGEDCLQLVHQSTIGEQHGDSWGGEGTISSHFDMLYACLSVCVCLNSSWSEWLHGDVLQGPTYNYANKHTHFSVFSLRWHLRGQHYTWNITNWLNNITYTIPHSLSHHTLIATEVSHLSLPSTVHLSFNMT